MESLSIQGDIAGRKAAEDALRESEHRYRLLSETMLQGVVYQDANGVITSMNPAAERILGKTREEFLGSSSVKVEHHTIRENGERFPGLEHPAMLALQTGQPVEAVVMGVFNPKIGEYRWISIGAVPVFSPGGTTPSEVFTVFEDITARKQMEMELVESNLMLNSAAHIAHLGTWKWNINDNSNVWSEEQFRILGIPTDARPSFDLFFTAVHPDDHDKVKAAIEKALKNIARYEVECRVIWPDGELRHVNCQGEIQLDRAGQPLNMIGSLLDITEFKHAVWNYSQLFQEMLDGFALHEIICDPAGNPVDYRFLAVNPAFEQMTGLRGQDIVGLTVLEALPGTEQSWIEKYGRVAVTGEPIFFENFSASLNKYFDVKAFRPAPNRFVCIFSDISERKQAELEKRNLEQQLIQSQKLESLGVLAGGIAHDFNNILAIIVGHCSLAEMDPKTADTHIPEIEKAAERAAGLCRQMLAYAGKGQFILKEVKLAEIVDEMVSLLKATISQNVTIKQNIPADLPLIKADIGQLRQIVMNLIINASEAIGEAQGEVCISLTRKSITAAQQEKDHLGKIIKPGWYACLEVTDNGCGMDDETRRRIFEPFFSTKFTGRGLGMSAVLGIISTHLGALQLFSEPGSGTTFTIYLPLPAGDYSQYASYQPVISSEPWHGKGTILLVEDEEQVRIINTIMLQELGFSVIEAGEGKEALERYRKHAADITLVVTDLGMPVMDGYMLVRELKNLKPDLPIIISSGFGESVIRERLTHDDIAGIVSKPFDFYKLRDVIKSVSKECDHI